MQGIWKLSLATAFLFTLGACSNSSSAAADEYDSEYSSAGGSSKDAKSSSSNSKICKSVSETLAAPTNLQVVENGENKWVLIWDYTPNDERLESGFLIEVLNMSDKQPKWKTFDSTNAEVVMYNLSGASNADKYYRVSAMDECGVSKASDMVEIIGDSSTATTNANLAVPSNLKLENLGDNMWQLSWSYTNNENRPEQGFKLQSLNLDDKSPKWSDDGTTNKGVHVVKIDGNKKGGLLYHVAAKDDKGVSEYSEEITIPRVSDSTSTSNSMDLAVPTNLKLDSIDVSKYKLSWSYTDNTNRPENGFKLQSLNLEDKKPSWAVMDSTNKGVYMIIIDATKKGGYYVRVAAKDSKGVSKYSSEIEIPKISKKTNVAEPPADIALTRIAPSVWELSWSYSASDENPDRKFIIQSSKLKDFKWVSVASNIKGNVRNYYIQGRDKIESYYRMAVVNDGDTSAYSDVIQLTPEIKYRDYMALEVPVPSEKFVLGYTTAYEADKDTATKDDITYINARATYTITDKFISKYIVESEYTDTAYYEARWFISLEQYNYYKGSCEGKKKGDKCDSCYWVESFPYEEPSITKRFDENDYADAAKKTTIYASCKSGYDYVDKDHSKLYSKSTPSDEWEKIIESEYGMSMCIPNYVRGICNYYVQIRIVWKDVNGETDWSEWTQPFNISDISGADDLCNLSK